MTSQFYVHAYPSPVSIFATHNTQKYYKYLNEEKAEGNCKCRLPESKGSGFWKFNLETLASFTTISVTEMPLLLVHFIWLIKDN